MTKIKSKIKMKETDRDENWAKIADEINSKSFTYTIKNDYGEESNPDYLVVLPEHCLLYYDRYEICILLIILSFNYFLISNRQIKLRYPDQHCERIHTPYVPFFDCFCCTC